MIYLIYFKKIFKNLFFLLLILLFIKIDINLAYPNNIYIENF
jgi:hypothetical protein